MDVHNSDDKEIEAEIQRALDALDLEGGDDEETSQVGELESGSLDGDLELTNEVLACLSEFIVRAQSRADGIQQELSECDALLASVIECDREKREEYFYQSDELKEYAFQIGEDPEELRDRVIRELDADDDGDGQSTVSQGGPGVKILSLEGPLFEATHADGESPQNGEERFEYSRSGTQDDAEPVQRLEDAARKTVREFEVQFDSCLNSFREGYEEGQRSTRKREILAEQRRAERIKQNNDDLQRMAQERMIQQTELQEDLDRRNKETETLLAQYQSEIREMDARTKQEKLAFLEQRLAHQKSLSERMTASATKIQAVYRSYRARKPYREKMRLLCENVRKKQADKRQMEIAAERRLVEQRRRKERDEKRRREEEERCRKEEEEKRHREEERLRREAAEREERERVLEQKRQREAEEQERRLAEEREEREQREMEEKANIILAKIAKEKRDEEEKGEENDRHDGGGSGMGTGAVSLDAGDNVDRLEESVLRSDGGSEGVYIKNDANIAGDTDISEDVNTHEVSNNNNEVIVAHSGGHDQRLGHGAEDPQAEVIDRSGRGGESDNSGVLPAVTVTIVTERDGEIYESRRSSEDTKVGKLQKCGSADLNNRDEVQAGTMVSDDHGRDESLDAAFKSTDIEERVERNLNMHELDTSNLRSNEVVAGMVRDSHHADESYGSHAHVDKSPGRSHDGKPTADSSTDSVAVGHSIMPKGALLIGRGMKKSVQCNKAAVGLEASEILSSPEEKSSRLADGKALPPNQTVILRDSRNSSTKLGESTTARSVPTVDGSPAVNVGKESGENSEDKDGAIDLIKQGILIGQSALPDAYEKARLKWMETSTPFSKSLVQAKDNLRALEQRKRRYLRRPSALKKMSPVTEEKLLAAACPVTATLSEVTTLQLSDLSGCALSTLTGCPRLKALACRRSQLSGLEGLERSPEVTFIDFRGNHVAFINCRDLSCLTYLDLSGNDLTTIHGLEGCGSLKWLNLSRNKITRLSGIECLIALSHLDLAHNQLINVQGLSSLVHLTSLDLSDNHLSSVPGLESCPLLQCLRLCGNSLSKPPELPNHVLLTEMSLDNNSLVTMETIQTAWLPRLQTLSLAQNSLSVVPVLDFALSMRKLDLRNNYITDVSSLEAGLSKLPYLKELLIEGNPVTEEGDCRDVILRLAPSLSLLDGNARSTPPVNPRPLSQFEVMCRLQVRAIEALQERRETVLSSVGGDTELNLIGNVATSSKGAGFIEVDDTEHLKDAAAVWGRFLDCSQKMAVDQRYMHEYGDLSAVQFSSDDLSRMIPDIVADPRSHRDVSEHAHSSSRTDKEPGRLIPAGQYRTESCDELGGPPGKLPSSDHLSISDDRLRKSSENVEGAALDRRGDNKPRSGDAHVASHDLPLNRPSQRSSGHEIETTMEGTGLNKSDAKSKLLFTHGGPRAIDQALQTMNRHSQGSLQETAVMRIQALWRGYQVRRDIARHTQRYLAAVSIQALWRGHAVRKRYRKARAALRVSAESDEDGEFVNDVDLEFLDYSEEALDREWFPWETPDVPMSHPVLPSARPPSASAPQRPISSVALDGTSPPADRFLPHPPRQAWRGVSQETLSSKPPLPPVTPSPSRGESSLGSTARTVRSKKEQQLTEEWGFRDNQTAELMMRRAKKMNRGGKKKTLDPIQKLQMLNKARDANTTPVAHSNTRRGVQRKEYFKAKDEVRDAKVHEVNERTYQWVHSQVPHPDQHSPLRGRNSSSEPNLPRMSPDVLQGRVQLMASPSLELESVDGLSVHGGGMVRGRSNSLTSPEGNRNQLPSLKTNSAPTDHTRQRQAARVYGNKRR